MKNRKHYQLSLIMTITVISVLLFTSCVLTTASPLDSTENIFYPTEISDVLYNPFMGLAPFAIYTDYPVNHTLVLAQTTWREIEENKGVFDFESFEKKNNFEYWEKKGVRILLQINLDFPAKDSHLDIPDWLYEETGKDGTWYDINWGKGYSPNYSNTVLMSYHKTLIQKMAQRYGNDKSVFIILLGSVGHWGEWHVSPKLAGKMPNQAISDIYIQDYISNYKNKFLSIRFPRKIAKDNNFGLHNNSFGDRQQTYNWFIDWFNYGFENYLTNEFQEGMPDFWKTAPSGGEFANYPSLQYLSDSNTNELIDMAQKSHTSWLYVSPEGAALPNTQKLLNNIGYRFVIKSATFVKETVAKESVKIAINIVNKGVAPLYFNWPFEVSVWSEQGSLITKTVLKDDIRKMLPGNYDLLAQVQMPENVIPGNYEIRLGILNPDTMNASVNFANNGRTSDGRYLLGKFEVKSTLQKTNSPLYDVPSSFWAHDSIFNIFNKKIVTGRPNGSFEPDANITRAELLALVTKAYGLTVESANVTTVSQFMDVDRAKWYYPYVTAAYNAGIVIGDLQNYFYPDRNITRQDVAVIISKVLSIKKISAIPKTLPLSMPLFKDSHDIFTYAVSHIALLENMKILSGFSDGNFYPQKLITRAQAATILDKLLAKT